jgi:hypothetical protein
VAELEEFSEAALGDQRQQLRDIRRFLKDLEAKFAVARGTPGTKPTVMRASTMSAQVLRQYVSTQTISSQARMFDEKVRSLRQPKAAVGIRY